MVFYASPHCTAGLGEFTADVRLTVPEFHRIWRGTDFPKNPGSADGCIEVGVGCLRDNSELWWDVEQDLPTSEIERIAGEICIVISQNAIRYVKSFATIGDLLSEIQTHPGRCVGVAVWLQVIQAILLHIDGKQSEAAEIIRRSWSRESDAQRKDGLEIYAERMGIPL